MYAAGHRGAPIGGDGTFGGGSPFGGGDEPCFGRKRQRRGDVKFILLELLKDTLRHSYELSERLKNVPLVFIGQVLV